MQVAHVMRGVTRCVGHFEAIAEQLLASLQNRQVPLGHGEHLAPQAVHVLAVELARAGQQSRGVDHVCRPALVDVHLELWPALHQRAADPRVVEVDVREQKRPRPLVTKGGEQRRQA